MRIKIFLSKVAGLIIITGSIAITGNAQNIKVQSGTFISGKGGAVITLNNTDLQNDGTINQQPGDGRFVFSGNTSDVIAGASSSLFDILEIAKTGSAKLTLQQGIQVGSNITFTSGIIDLNQQNILLQPAALLNGESETSYITGINGGYIEITNTLMSPSAVNPGNLGLVISSSQNMGSTIIRRGHQSQINNTGNGKTIYRYFDVIPTVNTGLNATLQLNYLDAEKNSLDENQFTMWSSADNQHWANLGFSARDNAANYVQQTGINSFARFTLTEALSSLPLVWAGFNTQCVNGQTKLSWETKEEQNTDVFVIRRSSNGTTWTDIATIPAAGNSQTGRSYAYIDVQPVSGIGYYQIWLKDKDGHISISPVLINQCGQSEAVKAYPNPVQNTCTVNIHSDAANLVTLRLYDNLGSLLQQHIVSLQPGNNQYEVPMSKYAQGTYSLVVIWNNEKVNVVKLEK